MDLITYTKQYKESDAISVFLDFYYSLNMTHLASDLLDKGLSPDKITKAVAAAMKIASASGLETMKHFMPVYSNLDDCIIQDCKLSHLAYGLVLMNADADLPIVGQFQVDLLLKYLERIH
jgi:hypothetical protein